MFMICVCVCIFWEFLDFLKLRLRICVLKVVGFDRDGVDRNVFLVKLIRLMKIV